MPVGYGCLGVVYLDVDVAVLVCVCMGDFGVCACVCVCWCVCVCVCVCVLGVGACVLNAWVWMFSLLAWVLVCLDCVGCCSVSLGVRMRGLGDLVPGCQCVVRRVASWIAPIPRYVIVCTKESGGVGMSGLCGCCSVYVIVPVGYGCLGVVCLDVDVVVLVCVCGRFWCVPGCVCGVCW